MNKIKMIVKCVTCGANQSIEVDEAWYEKFKSGMSVQDALPKSNLFTRECLISGMCFDCQSRVFHRPKPGESWGEILGECECCGSSVYERDNGVCPQCGTGLSEGEEDDGDSEC